MNGRGTSGPNQIHQVLTVATGYGYMSRCGCGWRALHPTEPEGKASGEAHIRTRHQG